MSNRSSRNITLNKEDIQKCRSFAEKFASFEAEKSDLDFGSITNMSRDLIDKTADIMTGKLAEVAFNKFCELSEFKIGIDFDIYKGRLNIDNGQDITSFQGKANKIKCDIKGTKHFAQWLLVEEHKINEELIFSDIYIFVKLILPQGVEKNLNLFNKKKIDSSIVGYAFKEDFFDRNNKPWFHYKEARSPLTGYFAKQIIIKAIESAGTVNNLEKKDLIKSFRKLRKGIDSGIHFLKMKQKAANNYGLPVDFLRSSDADFHFLFNLLLQQQLFERPRHIFDR